MSVEQIRDSLAMTTTTPMTTDYSAANKSIVWRKAAQVQFKFTTRRKYTLLQPLLPGINLAFYLSSNKRRQERFHRFLPDIYYSFTNESRNNLSICRRFSHAHSPSGFSRIFILHTNIHATRVVTLTADELGTTSKNNLRGCIRGIHSHFILSLLH